MNQQVADYIAALPVEHRLLFERNRGLILEACPSIEVVFAYKMPTTYWIRPNFASPVHESVPLPINEGASLSPPLLPPPSIPQG